MRQMGGRGSRTAPRDVTPGPTVATPPTGDSNAGAGGAKNARSRLTRVARHASSPRSHTTCRVRARLSGRRFAVVGSFIYCCGGWLCDFGSVPKAKRWRLRSILWRRPTSTSINSKVNMSYCYNVLLLKCFRRSMWEFPVL